MEPIGIMDAFAKVCEAISTEALIHYGPRLVSVAVYGSVGRGTPRRDSDIDLLVVAEELPRGRMPRMAEFQQIENRLAPALQQSREHGLSTQISPVIRSPEEIRRGSLLLLDMTEDARILFDRAGFLKEELDLLRQRLAKLGARRIPYRGAWYWLLKDEMEPGEVFRIW